MPSKSTITTKKTTNSLLRKTAISSEWILVQTAIIFIRLWTKNVFETSKSNRKTNSISSLMFSQRRTISISEQRSSRNCSASTTSKTKSLKFSRRKKKKSKLNITSKYKWWLSKRHSKALLSPKMISYKHKLLLTQNFKKGVEIFVTKSYLFSLSKKLKMQAKVSLRTRKISGSSRIRRKSNRSY